ncbi:type II toxin-antitoxin system antitoxin DNA ADP-ribosyl glycohydrolase DarG [Helicovermis profundi]|uniref:Macro domain-containing protein n=1 Tax=Helicovermis profundi TaxID=3065157 RepID=A0AAU9E4C8_9FIRM|nr:macro domain-containing protein [Clostridia bacterium S502]
MIYYTTGNLLKSDAYALVNTVNCEGYMGKGIAYQFKLEYPQNNIAYIKACKSRNLSVGKLHHFKEKEKFIINFPTKDKWREKSKMIYIKEGLEELAKLIIEEKIKSIAIPPLGSGNGGLIWSEVRILIEEKLSAVADSVKIIIYEPSQNYTSKVSREPNLSLSSLVLMQIKLNLEKFDKIRLQKTVYFMNLFSGENYFKFSKYKYGPYDNSIAIISKKIKEFQSYHNVKDTSEAYSILYKKLISNKVETKLEVLEPAINQATMYVNSIDNDHELECLSTVAYLLETNIELTESEIVEQFNNWSKTKSENFSNNEIKSCLIKLYNDNIVDKTLTGYQLHKYNT